MRHSLQREAFRNAMGGYFRDRVPRRGGQTRGDDAHGAESGHWKSGGRDGDAGGYNACAPRPGPDHTVDALVSDLAGNTATAQLSLSVLTGGFVSGEVYDESQGIPLPSATVDFGTGTTTSDVSGRFGFFTEDPNVAVRIERTSFTTVERSVLVDSVQGTLLLDARLTPGGRSHGFHRCDWRYGRRFLWSV